MRAGGGVSVRGKVWFMVGKSKIPLFSAIGSVLQELKLCF